MTQRLPLFDALVNVGKRRFLDLVEVLLLLVKLLVGASLHTSCRVCHNNVGVTVFSAFSH